jgi:protocatechuate 3,4-dioxygenase beta subunit
MSQDSFFARRARRLLRSPVAKPLAPVVPLEDRLAPAVTGRVFQDFNANGRFDTTQTVANAGAGTVGAAIDVGVGGVTVTAYTAAGAVAATTTTAANGTYTLGTAAGTYRVEFTGLPAGAAAGPHGANNGTPVQFVANGGVADFAVVRAADYYRPDPLLLTSEYIEGDPALPVGTYVDAGAGSTPTILSFPYSAGTTDQTDQTTGRQPTTHQVAIRADSAGATWGLGYDRGRGRVFASTYTKRHAAWGPDGPGTIYTFDVPASGAPVTTATPWFTLPRAAVLGTATGAADPTAFGDFRTGYTTQDDYASDGGDKGWNAVGKTSFGGLDVNDAGTELYVMNLFDRSLYVVPINPDGSAGTPAAFPVPVPANATGVTPANPLGDVRPFAVQFYRGRVYVGMVNSAESTGVRSDLRAYVYAFDPVAKTYSAQSVLNETAGVEGVRLDYDKGNTYGGNDRFLPWTSTVNTVLPITNGGSGRQAAKYPQPMLSGIAFDAAGNMTLGLRDRGGDQQGRGLPSDPRNPLAFLEGISAGDILKAFANTPGSPAAGWQLERNGSSPVAGNPGTGTGPGNNAGPLTNPALGPGGGNTGGEFYAQDGLGGTATSGGDTSHADVAVGGVLQVPGFPDVLTTAYDPLRRGPVRTGGVRWFDSTSGLLDKSYELYTTDQGGNTFGKANGVGDLIAFETTSPPAEIGNRVFLDANGNGLQDPGEAGVDGVRVELRSADGLTLLATAVTANGGQYYFNSGAVPAGVTPGANEVYNVAPLAPGGSYQVRIPFGSGGANGSKLGGLIPTRAFADPLNPQRDSDARAGNLVAGSNAPADAAVIPVTVANVAGATDHTFDAGFVNGLALGDFVFVDQNNDGTYTPLDGDVGLDNVPVSLFAADAAGNPTGAAVATANTSGGGKYTFTNLLPGRYVVQIAAPAGYRSSTGTPLDPVNGPFESGLVTNTNTDNEDHGFTVAGTPATGVTVRTKVATLFDPNDPLNANPDPFPGTVGANLRQDFGLYPVYGLGNRVFIDANNDGLLDNGEAGRDGVTVRLYRPADFDAAGQLLGGATPVRTTTTANGGYYRFDDLLGSTAAAPAQGQYVVVVDGTTGGLAGFRSSTGGTSATTTFEPSPTAIPPLAPAGGRIDGRDNGTTLAAAQVRSPVATLGPGGNAPTGEADLVPGTPAAQAQGSIDAQADMTIDFGFFRPLALGNLVWLDANNSGTVDAADGPTPGIDGVTVQLFRALANGTPVGPALGTQTTKGGGYYQFTGLGADTYVVVVDGKSLPGYGAGTGYWVSSSGANGAAAGPFEPGADPTADRRDAIDRGTTARQDAAAFTVRSEAVTLTAGSGPAGQAATPPAAGYPTVPLADANLTIDFGFYQPLSLGDLVWVDANNNGVFDAATETGKSGVPVRLYADTDADGRFDPTVDQLVATQATNGTGNYLFTNLAAGGYFVEITPPAGYGSSSGTANSPSGPFEPGTADVSLAADGTDHGTNAGTVIRSQLVTLAVGGESKGFPAVPGFPAEPTADGNKTYAVDFGIYQALQLGDFVFEDVGNNGVFDGTDRPLAGVTVTLLDAAGTPIPGQTTTTDANGKYLFRNLLPGTYSVRVTPPAGYASSTGANGKSFGPFEPGANDFSDDADHGTASGAFVVSGPVVLGRPGDTAANPDGAGFANLRQDFGLFRPLSLGNFVWEDANNNGVFDAGERPLANVPVALLAGGATVGTTVTDANGNYLFTGLVPGSYTVRVTTPAGYASSTGTNGRLAGPYEPGVSDSTDNADHGTANGTFADATATLGVPGDTAANPDAAGTANLRQDFGFYRPLSLGDFVWNDRNNNGVLDAGEPALPGVPVALLDAAGTVVGTTTTDAGGKYRFDNLAPGAYTVRVTPPAGFVSSTGQPGSPTGPFEPGVSDTTDDRDHGTRSGAFVTSSVTLAAAGSAANPDAGGLANLRQDFGLFQPVGIGNFVWEDANNNGTFDPGEVPLANVPVALLANGRVIATATTDARGGYFFGDLVPGTYQVRVTPPAGYASSTGGGNNFTAGPFEPGAAANTDAADHGTAAGAFVLAAPVTLGSPGDTAANPDNAGTANLRQDFGLVRPGLSLGDLVWNDVNNNGVRDAGEPGLAGVTVRLLGPGGAVVATTTTDAAGNYLFTALTPGDYTVSVTPPAGYVTSTGTVGSPAGPYEPGVSGSQDGEDHGTAGGGAVATRVSLFPVGDARNPDLGTSANLRQDFGLFQPIRLGNTVFLDANDNGLLDPGESVLPGLTVNLLTPAGAAVATTTTDAAGRYLFDELVPGQYVVEVVPPAGSRASDPVFPFTAGDQQNIGTQAGATIRSGVLTLAIGAAPAIGGNTDANTYVAGDIGVLGLAEVSGYTYFDRNRSGSYDPAGPDRAIPNVVVTLTGNGITRTTTSDGTGFYRFTGLPPGSYTITETQPPGTWYQGTDNPGSLGGTNPTPNVLTVTLAPNDAGRQYNFGEVPPGAVFGYVWVDLDRSRTFDPGEPVIGGVPVTIGGTTAAGRPLTPADVPGGSLTATTDATGRYEFPVLPPGTYTLSRGVLPPAAAARYADFALQNGDPAGPAPTAGGVTGFGGVVLTPLTRGPFNFGVVPAGAVAGDEPTKRDFLGSTPVPTGAAVPAAGGMGGATLAATGFDPTFAVSSGTPTKPDYVVVAGGDGLTPSLRVFDYATGLERFRLQPYEAGFTGGVRTAVGDVTGDGVPDVVTVTGPGGGPRVRVFSGVDGTVVRDFFAFEPEYRGGAWVTAADLDGDGRAEIVVGADQGGGPRVIVMRGADPAPGSGGVPTVLGTFFAFDADQRGGVRVAAADVTGDGVPDLIATAGPGVVTRVRVFDGATLGRGSPTPVADFAPFEAAYTGGVNLAAADYTGDGRADLVVGADAGGGPRVMVFDGTTLAGTPTPVANLYAFDAGRTGGVRVAARDVTGDGRADLILTPGAGSPARVRVLRAGDLTEVDGFTAFDPVFTGGAYVG